MVNKMQESGFCAGVQNAVDLANKQCEKIRTGEEVYFFGELVNNDHVMRAFRDKGCGVADDVRYIPDGATVVVRTHGVSRKVCADLQSIRADVVDCTCVRVKKVHEIVAAKSREGCKIIVIGTKTHPEVVGTVGWCSGNTAHVVEKASDLDNIDLSGKVCVVAQTTCNSELWRNVTDLIRSINPSADIHDTLCNVTSNREKRAKSVAGSSDAMIVIGDQKSSNSKELYAQCRLSCNNTFFIGSLSELEARPDISAALSLSTVIGLAASASTPDDIIADVYHYLVFLDFLKAAKGEIEDAARAYCHDFAANAADNPFVQKALDALFEQNEGGKRIRGAMIKLGEAIASHGVGNKYLPIAVGYELFQTAILIHDDIIDRSDTRRNKATIHAGAGHFGASRALCIGDYGFFISYQFLAKCKVESTALTKIYQLYSQILAATCEGELMDVMLPSERIGISDNYDEYMRIVTQIYEYKTAWYTLAGPLMLGAICGGASDELAALLRSIAIPLGIAFQIKDDLLGIYSSCDVLGKPVLSDIRENKQTLMYGYAYKHASDQERGLLDRHYGRADAGQHDLDIVRKLFTETGAKKYAEDEIQALSNRSTALIENDLIDSDCQLILKGLSGYLTGRQF